MTFSRGTGTTSLFPARSSKSHLSEATVSMKVRDISDYVFKVNLLDPSRRLKRTKPGQRVEDESFCYADFRRTTESRRIELHVPNGVIAQLLSHGRSGVQHKHYDRANYLPMKREALQLWERFLIQCPDEQRAEYLNATGLCAEKEQASTRRPIVAQVLAPTQSRAS